ncbi:hypothetical protein QCA50_015458 [Cerrena zonata]|uniref:Replication factor A protein 3 n=1 Tax=Cerrena zonata TaxID=2478898 RepID=A0AAW0FMG8_9APHY
MSDITSPRVNSARLADHVGRHVRLAGKVLKVAGDAAIVEASDGGNVEVKILGSQAATIKDQYVEIVGQVTEPGVVKMLNCINLGDKLDMAIVDFVVEKWHSPQFSSMF